jgi:CBS domain-containing protein
MAYIPDELRAHALKIQSNEPGDGVTTRTLLAWFGAQRRGYRVVHQIRRALRELGLATEPDFRFSWLDGAIHFLAEEPEVDLEAEGQITEQPAAAPAAEEPALAQQAPEAMPHLVGGAVADPTHRIGQLDAANRGVVFVAPNDSIERAITLLLANNYSQLPVMTSSREVKGMVTWESIGRRLLLAGSCARVYDCMGRHHEIGADDSLFAAIPEIVEYQYVLVRAADKQITGIVTAADLSVQFRQLAEPFLLLGEIENQIRRLIEHRFTEEELAAGKDPGDTERTIASVADLSLGECVRLLENEERWQKLGLRIDRGEFVKEAHRIRTIRNDVMHFEPDPMSVDELSLLRRFAEFLSTLSEFVVTAPKGNVAID